MTHLQKLRIELAKELVNLFEIPTNEGVLITETEEVIVGTEVFIYDENGSFIPAPDGQYTTDSQIITVVSGVISNIEDITPQEAPVEETPEETPIEDPDEDQMGPSFEERLNEVINSVNTLTTELNTLRDSVAELVNDVDTIKSSIESINTSMTNFSMQKPSIEVKDKRSDKGINPIFSI